MIFFISLGLSPASVFVGLNNFVNSTLIMSPAKYIDLDTTEVYLHLNQQEAVEEVKSKMKDFFFSDK